MSDFKPRISEQEFEEYLNIKVEFLELFKYPFRSSLSIFMIVFSLIYLIFPKGISILGSLLAISIAFFFSAFQPKSKGNKFIPAIFTIIFIVLAWLDFGSSKPERLDFIFGITVAISIFLGLLLTLFQVFEYIPKKFISYASFVIFLLLIIGVYYIRGTFPAILDGIYTIIEDQESALSKIGTAGTTLSLGMIIIDSLRKKIKREKQKNSFAEDSTLKLATTLPSRSSKK
ncbi:hypothetical protein [Priestia megaterium]|uniref:hypothetical protein n=1 Tax=Priestia megaterium TaxID=1404 RepID=UPI002FFFA3AD